MTKVLESFIEKRQTQTSTGTMMTKVLESFIEKRQTQTSTGPVMTKVLESFIEKRPAKSSSALATRAVGSSIGMGTKKSPPAPTLRNLESNIKKNQITSSTKPRLTRAAKRSSDRSITNTITGLGLASVAENPIRMSPIRTSTEPSLTIGDGNSIKDSLYTKPSSILSMGTVGEGSTKANTALATGTVGNPSEKNLAKSSTALNMRNVEGTFEKIPGFHTAPDLAQTIESSIENSLSTKPRSDQSIRTVERTIKKRPTATSTALVTKNVEISDEKSLIKTSTTLDLTETVKNSIEDAPTTTSFEQRMTKTILGSSESSITTKSGKALGIRTVKGAIDARLTSSTWGLGSSEAAESFITKTPTNSRWTTANINEWQSQKSRVQLEITTTYTNAIAMPSRVELEMLSDGKTSLIQPTPPVMTVISSASENLNTTSHPLKTGTADPTRAGKSYFAMSPTKNLAPLASVNYSSFEDFSSHLGEEETTSAPLDVTVTTPMTTMVKDEEPVKGKSSSIQPTPTAISSQPENHKKSREEKPSGALIFIIACYLICIIMIENQRLL
ncbi:uncharacterized protein LOC114525170 isoform X2 [Dendronephthya gigantea]|nr:uncharacterized protein LOC114525170 isoform X2 [Dendronephthya gigantea]